VTARRRSPSPGTTGSTDGSTPDGRSGSSTSTIAIRLTARPSTNQTDLAEAHAIIESMRTEARDNDLGSRLIFALTTDDWDSG
jgi:hypothetical protein